VSKWLVGVTLIVLIIACSNVANLLLARAIRRQAKWRFAALGAVTQAGRLFVTEACDFALGGVAALAVPVSSRSGTERLVDQCRGTRH
jgi:hypothetical protein